MITQKIVGGGLILRQIELNDCKDRYVEWLNDPEVNQYMETKWSAQNRETIRAFVQSQRENNHSILFAIVVKETGQHIGNIKIGPIHPHYRHADISYYIGEKTWWGKGCATQAIRLVCQFGFQELGLHRIEAGTYACARGSQRALEKNGFQREGVFREQVCFDGNWTDIYRYALLESEEKIRS